MRNPYVQLAELEIDREQLDAFKAAATEQIETAVREEPGVLVLYAVSDRADPTRITVFEIYRDSDAYEAHRQSAHFLTYKAITADMVKKLRLIPVDPVLLGAKPR